jgi:small subunit ribosomal protein S27Ae
MKKIEIFKVEGDKISRQRRNCPKCGDGVFLADHKNRLSCGKCGYTEFKGKKEPEISVGEQTKDIKTEKTTEDLKPEDKVAETATEQPKTENP